jgi:hypothetical protein
MLPKGRPQENEEPLRKVISPFFVLNGVLGALMV